MRVLLILITCLFALLLYPLGLALVVIADTLVGDAEFARHLLMGSQRALLYQLLADWYAALLFALPLWFLVGALSRLGCTTFVITACLGLGLILTVLAVLPPYLPLIFVPVLVF